MPVGVQQQVCRDSAETFEVPHVQFIDKFVAVPADFLLHGAYGGDEGFFGLFRPFFALLRVVPELSAR